MPILPENRGRYLGGSPTSREWKALRAAVLKRAGWRCEGSPAFPDCRAEHGKPHPATGAAVVLTIAHLDHDPANNAAANLAAWCQRCHNRHDAPHRAQTRARRRAERVEAPQ